MAYSDQSNTPSETLEDIDMASIRESIQVFVTPLLTKYPDGLTATEMTKLPAWEGLGLTTKQFGDALINMAIAGKLQRTKVEGSEQGAVSSNRYTLPPDVLAELLPKPKTRTFIKPKAPAPAAAKPVQGEFAIAQPKEKAPRKIHHGPNAKGLDTEARFIDLIREIPGKNYVEVIAHIHAQTGISRAYVGQILMKMIRRNVLRRDGTPRLGTLVVVADERKALKAQAEEQRRLQEEAAQAQQAETVQEVVDVVPEPAAPAQPARAGLAIPLDAIGAGISNLAESIAAQIAAQIAGRLMDALESLQAAIPQNAPSMEDFGKAVARAAKPKIAILGLLPSQAGMIRVEFPQFDFSFVTADELQRAPAVAQHADRIYAMTNFISHSLEGQVKNLPGYTRVSGGVTSLREQLRQAMQ